MVDPNLKIETYKYSGDWPFVINDNFEFEIRRLTDHACITVPHFDGIFITHLDKEITENQARWILYAYLKGRDDGVRSVFKPEKTAKQIQRKQVQ